MIDDESVLALAAAREGYEPVTCTPVALPAWRLQVRVELLARRDISPLEEFVLRAALDADPKAGAIQALLGLDERTFEDVLATVVGREWAKVGSDARVRLTSAGRLVSETRRRERSEERMVAIDFDGLLRRPLFVDAPLEPAQARSLGLLELPAWPPAAPDALELGEHRPELETLIRRAGDGRDQEIDLLAIKGVLRRERIHQEAALCVLRSAGGDLQAVPVIDGQPSPEHEIALASPESRRSLRLASELRRGRRYEQLLPASARDLHDANADAKAAALRLRSRAPALAAEADSADAGELRRQAAEATRRLLVRRVAPQEHPRLLLTAVRTARRRLLFEVPALSAMSMDAELLGELRRLLGRGATLTIVHATPAEPTLPGFVRSLFERDGAHEVRVRKVPAASTLIRDDSLALRTLYPLLGDRGRRRPVRDERGWLVSDPGQVAVIAQQVTDASTAQAVGPAAPAGGRR